MVSFAVSGSSREEVPTNTSKSPLTGAQACVVTSQIAVDHSVRGNSTVVDAPAASITFLKPLETERCVRDVRGNKTWWGLYAGVLELLGRLASALWEAEV